MKGAAAAGLRSEHQINNPYLRTTFIVSKSDTKRAKGASKHTEINPKVKLDDFGKLPLSRTGLEIE